MVSERRTPAGGVSAGVPKIEQASRIGTHGTTGHRPGGDYGYPVGAFGYWSTTRRCDRMALRDDLRLVGFAEAVAVGLVDVEKLAFPPTAAERVVA